jgi:hypothetical protein
MNRIKWAYRLGFGAMAVLLLYYLFVLGIPSLINVFQDKKVDLDVVLVSAAGVLVLTLIAGMGLLGARQDPRLAGTVEMVLGSLFLVFTLVLLPFAISYVFGLTNPGIDFIGFLFVAFLGTGSLLFVSGRLFWKSAGKQKT